MAKEIKDIQQLINERAEKRLDQNILELRAYLHNGFASSLLNLGDEVQITANGKTTALRSAIWSTDSFLFVRIKESLIDEYKQKEAESFLKKVESLREDVDNLMNVPNNQDY